MEILSEITDWVNNTGDNVPRVLWLSGPAGKGKSAIAHTIAQWRKDVGGLGSCYCFDRQREADLLHKKMFSTIARDLANHNPEMRRALVDALKIDDALSDTDIIQQWKELLFKPMKKSAGSSEEPITIVIDALDESGGAQARRDLLRILASKHPNPAVPKIMDFPRNLRFIVTSRSLDDIENVFDGVQHIRRISMDDILLTVISIKNVKETGFGSGIRQLPGQGVHLRQWARHDTGTITVDACGRDQSMTRISA